jgi:hypothetical protein
VKRPSIDSAGGQFIWQDLPLDGRQLIAEQFLGVELLSGVFHSL